ncbi:MAG: DUF4149 domain-containing protein [Gammaproteobacteria bacterium]
MHRARTLLAGLWLGLLLTVALVATPAPFATLPATDAGRVVARVLASEAHASLALAALLFVVERRLAREGRSAMTTELLLVLGALFCTVLGYFALQPMMAAARAGQGPWSFGVLHAASTAFFGVKALLVLVLAWRSAAPR